MPTKLEIPKEVVLAEAAVRATKEREASEAEIAELEFKKKQSTAVALGAVLQTAKPTEGESDLHREVLAELLASLRDDSEDRNRKKKAETDQRNRLMLAQAQNVKMEKERQKRAQDFCSHIKENGRSRIGGQRLSNGHIAYICQYCHKEWNEETLPPSLQVSFDNIGG